MFEIVTDAAALDDLCERLRPSDWLGLDTEFVRESTFWARLCLVQVADRGGVVACVDPLAVPSLDPLFELLTRDGVTTVFHAGGQDLELIHQVGGVLPRAVFDTQVAAALLGDDDQIGYGAAVQARRPRRNRVLTRTTCGTCPRCTNRCAPSSSSAAASSGRCRNRWITCGQSGTSRTSTARGRA